MPLTRITDNVVSVGAIDPSKLSTGHPNWDSSSVLSATGFVGDGSTLTKAGVNKFGTVGQILTSNFINGFIIAGGFVGDGSELTNITQPVSVIEVTDNYFLVEPKHNNCTVILNSLSTINIDILVPELQSGHITSFVQYSSGRGNFISPIIYNADNFYQTRKQYAVCNLIKNQNFSFWTLYGDLTSTTLTSAPPAISAPSITFPRFTNIDAYMALSGDDMYILDSVNQGSGVFSSAVGSFQKVVSAVSDGVTITNPKFTKLASRRWANNSTLAALSGEDLYVYGDRLQWAGEGTGNIILEPRNSYIFTRVLSAWDRTKNIKNPKFTDFEQGFGNGIWALSGTDLYVLSDEYVSKPSGYTGDFNRADSPDGILSKVPGNWKKVYGGYEGSIAVSADGNLFATGKGNEYGKFGGLSTWLQTFTKVTTTPVDFKEISIGLTHTLALSSDGKLFARGNNEIGQLGDPNHEGFGYYWNTSYVFSTLNWKLSSVSCGYHHSVILSADGSLFSTGYNVYGQLGLGDTTTRTTFTQVTAGLPPNPKFIAIAAFGWTTYALSANGALFSTGLNYPSNALGQGTTYPTLYQRNTFTQITGVNILV